ncbi:MAG: hypothetical protein GY869_08100, partial [Planctomycetes bacterium]|nr:hypothetical protein [Planctomycetota bacterium]
MIEDKPAIRVVTATAIFDGHDVSVNIFRRVLQERGMEVIHLGHSRSVDEVVKSAIEEDVDAILVSSYQGGHNEYFQYIVDQLKEYNAENILVFGGGGGVILPSEIIDLEAYGVERLYHADDGKTIGIDGITDDLISRIEKKKTERLNQNKNTCPDGSDLRPDKSRVIAELISIMENGAESEKQQLRARLIENDKNRSSVLGITGTGGSGKSSITDELINRFLKVSEDVTVAILAVDPSKSTTGGALLGD